MSVRRLAEDAVQPADFKFSAANMKWAKETIRKYPKERQASAVIPLMMRAQDQDGWVTRASIESIADMLSMPYIRVLEVATFYTQFQLAPVGTKAHIQVCGTTPCMLRGSKELMKICKKKINEHPFETNSDGTLSWEEVECQGACVNAPMIMVFHDTYEDLTPERLEEIIDAFEAGKGDEITPGPQIDRVFSAPFGGFTSLTEDPNVKKSVRVSKTKAPAKAKSAAKATPAAKTATTASLSDENRPAKVRKPSKPDDLKLISGVGPKLEGVLNKLGIYTFDQIGKWKKAECEWVDGYLKFSGRIQRDDWVKQAKALAKKR
ncbi:MAG: NADH-quinone oxidoreductase subunit NuoE [Rhizobiaceae bacterium]|nr:NADH-quinone oxidoreductase subunit NuoE [Rhizobiaceae bacterium]